MGATLDRKEMAKFQENKNSQDGTNNAISEMTKALYVQLRLKPSETRKLIRLKATTAHK
ncbi:MAG: hypothetical protein KGH94_01620 [Candidatus Micrarchaeota archaeon]|nr:hypothetical protein [Candidatus Micrarchaeota archaeon]